MSILIKNTQEKPGKKTPGPLGSKSVTTVFERLWTDLLLYKLPFDFLKDAGRD
ncbi:hypothetical protein [Psychrobacillus antarcticus]|uniref:hypothetical protein n=1 Tax=Psychrobacillus antarcticus TaxID=2879115 RepID=UPI00240819C8|nr:hypothetical protein [Psychrobacillus antarcticus]